MCFDMPQHTLKVYFHMYIYVDFVMDEQSNYKEKHKYFRIEMTMITHLLEVVDIDVVAVVDMIVDVVGVAVVDVVVVDMVDMVLVDIDMNLYFQR
jgi:hypothetical protein